MSQVHRGLLRKVTVAMENLSIQYRGFPDSRPLRVVKADMERWDRAVAAGKKGAVSPAVSKDMGEDLGDGEAGGKFCSSKQGQVNEAEKGRR